VFSYTMGTWLRAVTRFRDVPRFPHSRLMIVITEARRARRAVIVVSVRGG